MTDIVARFARAGALYQEGQLDEAETLYRAILAEAPDHAGTHHLLGLIEHRLGRHEAALQSIARAIALNPREPNYHNNLGTVHRVLGHCDEAIACYRRALAIRPDFAAALNNLGLTQQQQQRLSDAQRTLEEALRLQPDYVAALFNLGNVLAARGLPDAAVTRYRQALALLPHHTDALNNLGAALMALGETAEGEACYRRAVALQPANAAAHNNLGNALAQRDALQEATAHFQAALAVEPHSVEARVNLGNVRLMDGDPAGAHALYAEALALDPAAPDPHRNDGLALLTQGALRVGFRQLRWNMPATQRFRTRLWRGEALAGATILIHAEQGFGDAIQFARYLPLVAARGGRILLEVPAELHALFAGIEGVETLLRFSDSLPPFTWHCPLLDLPIAFETTLATIPAAIPYLEADPAAVTAWRRRIAGPALQVGLVWAGRPEHKHDRHRSLALATLEPLWRVTDASFYALQKGAALDEASELPAAPALDIFAPDLTDFAATAAAIAALDLVITVDTSVAHLAGALGKPVWILLPYAADWRWLERRSDSPWYPSARLFRQDSSRRWEPVVAEITAALRDLAGQRRAAAARAPRDMAEGTLA